MGSEISMAINSARDIAIAAPVIGEANLHNQSEATISSVKVENATDVNSFRNIDITIEFTNVGKYKILDSGATPPVSAEQDYNSGNDINYGDLSFTITGTPAKGDKFQIHANEGGSSDNRNALELSNLSSKKVLDNGRSSLQEVYDTLVSEAGSQTRQVKINRDVQETMLGIISAQRESVSGVNLDEEAANLLKYQQAYQASARVVSIAKELFQTLMNAV
jgi:flagellar hook-associated protein 1 FlgK